MTCKDFQQKWNELLDAESGVVSSRDAMSVSPEGASVIEEAEAILLAHAADCPACRPIAARYQTLRHAIRAWRRPPAPPLDLVHRILSAPDDVTPRTRGAVARPAQRFWHDHRAPLGLVSGLAAAWLVSAGLLWWLVPRVNRAHRQGQEAAPPIVVHDLHSISDPSRPPGAPPALDRALADATSATWDLARSASEPAARISREVLDVTVQAAGVTAAGSVDGSAAPRAESDEELVSLSVALRSLDPLGADSEDGSGVLRLVGDQLSAGVRPLSSTARHAFGFLLGSPPPRDEPRPGGTTSSGARSG